MKMLISLLLLLSITTACASGRSKTELDAEVKRLCAIDGGVKVYETVKLPLGLLDKYGAIRIPDKARAKPSDEYYYDWTVTYLAKGKPEDGIPDLARSHFKLHRASDNKLMGESVAYTRRGGDIPGSWHPSHFTCPSDSGLTVLQNRVFISNTTGDSK